MVLPNPGMIIEQPRTALVITDLQNDFLSPGGAGWGLLKDSLARNNTIENIEALFRAAGAGGYPVILSPHYYYPADRRWVAIGGALEGLKRAIADEDLRDEVIVHGKLKRPELLAVYGRSHVVLVPTRSTFCEGMPMVAAEAQERDFYRAGRRAFLGDGAAYNWGIHRGYFPDFEPITDFVHVLCYLYLAAWATGGEE